MPDIRRIPGFFLGHATLAEAGTGCTAIVCPEGATGAVDVRGGAPATRETDLLRPEETVDAVHAVVLSGGSAFGLAAASGAAEELERRGLGLDMGVCRVPIVSAACLFDLTVGSASVRPGIAEGRAAVADALEAEAEEPLPVGNVGAGTGCTVGKFLGPERSMKGGLGTAVACAGELLVGAVAAVNAVGDVLDASGTVVAGARSTGDAKAPLPLADALGAMAAGAADLAPRANTTISCIVTNARLAKPQALRVAQMAADAYAMAIVPAHTSMDGDSIFCLASGRVAAEQDLVGLLAVQALSEAIVCACARAKGAFGLPGAGD